MTKEIKNNFKIDLKNLLENKQLKNNKSNFNALNVLYYLTTLIKEEEASKIDCQSIAARAVIRIINTGNLTTSLDYITTHTCQNRKGADKTGGQEKPEEFKGADLLKEIIDKSNLQVPTDFVNQLKQDEDIARAIADKNNKKENNK